MKKKNAAPKHKQSFLAGVKESKALYLLMLPSVIIFLLFTYYPMYGVIIAFKNFTPAEGLSRFLCKFLEKILWGGEPPRLQNWSL